MVNKLFKIGFVFWFAAAQILTSTAQAQSASGLSTSGIDVEPPLIEHEIVSQADSAVRQSFAATVVDDDELDSVSLFYRFEGDPTYSSVLMQRISFSSTYIAHVPTDPSLARNVEYYIQAIDMAGNRTVRGYAFNPLRRTVIPGKDSIVAEPPVTTAAAARTERSGSRRVLYFVLGVLAAGLVVGAISNTGGDNTGCEGGRCQITISVVQP